MTGAYNVRINPGRKEAHTQGIEYTAGPSAVLELVDIGVLLVTYHLLDEPEYGVYTVDGKDIASAHPSLAPKACVNCHSGYAEICVRGICTQPK
mgnify:CR=1 FL=1